MLDKGREIPSMSLRESLSFSFVSRIPCQRRHAEFLRTLLEGSR